MFYLQFVSLLVSLLSVATECDFEVLDNACDPEKDACAPGLFCSRDSNTCAQLFSLEEGKPCNFYLTDGYFSECQTHLFCDVEPNKSVGKCVQKLKKGEKCQRLASLRFECGEGLVCPNTTDADKRVCVEVFAKGPGQEATITHECQPHLMLSKKSTCEKPTLLSDEGCSDTKISLSAVFAHTGWNLEKKARTPIYAHCGDECELVVKAEECAAKLKTAFMYFSRFWDARGQDFALWQAYNCLEVKSFGDYPVDLWSWSGLEVLFFVLVLFFFLLSVASALLIVKYRSKNAQRAAATTATLLNS